MDIVLDKKIGNGELIEVKNDIITFYATVEVPDRDGDLIFINGIDTTNFEKNPVFLKQHEKDEAPIGKVVALRKNLTISPATLEIDVEFAIETEDGNEYKYLYDNGFMTSVSISFIPKNYTMNVEHGGYDIFSCELVEISAATIPSNTLAVVKKSFSQGKEIQKLKEIVDNITDKTNKFTETISRISERLDERDSINKTTDKTAEDSIYNKILNISNKIK